MRAEWQAWSFESLCESRFVQEKSKRLREGTVEFNLANAIWYPCFVDICRNPSRKKKNIPGCQIDQLSYTVYCGLRKERHFWDLLLLDDWWIVEHGLYLRPSDSMLRWSLLFSHGGVSHQTSLLFGGSHRSVCSEPVLKGLALVPWEGRGDVNHLLSPYTKLF